MTLEQFHAEPELVKEWRTLIDSPIFKTGMAVLHELHPARQTPLIREDAGTAYSPMYLGKIGGYEAALQNINVLASPNEAPKPLKEKYGKGIEA
jgi:hypothetical protein